MDADKIEFDEEISFELEVHVKRQADKEQNSHVVEYLDKDVEFRLSFNDFEVSRKLNLVEFLKTNEQDQFKEMIIEDESLSCKLSFYISYQTLESMNSGLD